MKNTTRPHSNHSQCRDLSQPQTSFMITTLETSSCRSLWHRRPQQQIFFNNCISSRSITSSRTNTDLAPIDVHASAAAQLLPNARMSPTNCGYTIQLIELTFILPRLILQRLDGSKPAVSGRSKIPEPLPTSCNTV